MAGLETKDGKTRYELLPNGLSAVLLVESELTSCSMVIIATKVQTISCPMLKRISIKIRPHDPRWEGSNTGRDVVWFLIPRLRSRVGSCECLPCVWDAGPAGG